jgi:hypothetical protein
VDLSSVVTDNFNVKDVDNKEQGEEQVHIEEQEDSEEEDAKLPAYPT